jgi:hypothetical protein
MTLVPVTVVLEAMALDCPNAVRNVKETIRCTSLLLKSAFSASVRAALFSSATLRRVSCWAKHWSLQRDTRLGLRADSCGSAPFQYETNSDEVRRQFEEHGEIKTFFDLIANRGMVFVTFVSVGHVLQFI